MAEQKLNAAHQLIEDKFQSMEDFLVYKATESKMLEELNTALIGGTELFTEENLEPDKLKKIRSSIERTRKSINQLNPQSDKIIDKCKEFTDKSLKIMWEEIQKMEANENKEAMQYRAQIDKLKNDLEEIEQKYEQFRGINSTPIKKEKQQNSLEVRLQKPTKELYEIRISQTLIQKLHDETKAVRKLYKEVNQLSSKVSKTNTFLQQMLEVIQKVFSASNKHSLKQYQREFEQQSRKDTKIFESISKNMEYTFQQIRDAVDEHYLENEKKDSEASKKNATSLTQAQQDRILDKTIQLKRGRLNWESKVKKMFGDIKNFRFKKPPLDHSILKVSTVDQFLDSFEKSYSLLPPAYDSIHNLPQPKINQVLKPIRQAPSRPENIPASSSENIQQVASQRTHRPLPEIPSNEVQQHQQDGTTNSIPIATNIPQAPALPSNWGAGAKNAKLSANVGETTRENLPSTGEVKGTNSPDRRNFLNEIEQKKKLKPVDPNLKKHRDGLIINANDASNIQETSNSKTTTHRVPHNPMMDAIVGQLQGGINLKSPGERNKGSKNTQIIEGKNSPMDDLRTNMKKRRSFTEESFSSVTIEDVKRPSGPGYTPPNHNNRGSRGLGK